MLVPIRSYGLGVLALALAAVAVSAPASADVMTFSNTNPITIPSLGAASPYPSSIVVSGVTAPIASITVTIHGLTHTAPVDVGALLVGPLGQKTYLFDGPGSESNPQPITNAVWTFDQAAAGVLPNTNPLPTTGTFRPNTYFNANFRSPAPTAPYTTSLTTGFVGTNANGTWSLYVEDFVTGSSGMISNGWSLSITPIPEPSSLALLGLGTVGLLGLSRRRRTA